MAIPIRKCYKLSIKKYISFLSFVIINRIYKFFLSKIKSTQFPFRKIICTNLISE